ncbi:MAG: folate-binding protein YgfZ [Rhodanobacter sp. 68-29]|uniref:CAF17-like 4Fe-4S cluster assembly/insertion protein YgfZ n=1 Tax=Rhodanobacter sp. PCA2 TaxID=2006117 RepID=UPI00086C6C52|nr:folate-binding protein [Rhodanobacter sp. PCA2]MBA2078598.1 folate-binding protein YgfZ [Rhodanobacter sp. PCA2]MBN8921842.1 folate-binding protein [Rhodanobacter sp.]ODU72689.1 MAG: folate-binding protein [Rhodanobacter sp. SCN 69-32]OJY61189.1 MAG: folate-binding protein YgfZ [Rhodanobacter sp. 68-29]
MSPTADVETLLIEGPDALAFAQAQFSSNVQSLPVGMWQFGAWLSPQGRVRALFHLARLDEQRLLLLLRGGNAATLGDALRRYVFRSRLVLQASPWRAAATAAALPLHALHDENGGIVFGCGTHALRLAVDGERDDAWRRMQLQLGWPWLPDSALDALLPPALSLHRLHAVAIDKGCYPGQEIVARMHWRGSHKRHLCNVRLTRSATPGDILRRDGNEVGTLLDAIEDDNRIDALAVLDDDIASTSTENTLLQLDDDLALSIRHRWEN